MNLIYSRLKMMSEENMVTTEIGVPRQMGQDTGLEVEENLELDRTEDLCFCK